MFKNFHRKLIAVNLHYWDTHDNCILVSSLNKLSLQYMQVFIKVKLDVQKYHGFQTKEW